MIHTTSHSPEETKRMGTAIGQVAEPGDVALLIGDLGAGKTCLTQGIARGLGIEDYTPSPSFVLVRVYHGRLPLYHVDLYRLHSVEEVADLGLDDYLYGKGISVVEWADRAPQALPPDYLKVEIGYASETERGITITACGKRYMEMLGCLRSELGYV
ncbi:MAG: tRNA (adenosine(37)-N6)-threonylcarbamoyltransferase complex ATPase subunit type 1 TsaE [Chloroflexi bacterium]|nr:tRNA (adenosine(37)-N6)-threonylcarbamoyltransferase complex ATPase subunit type 1 TsaE [Chloroflexota bacterium]